MPISAIPEILDELRRGRMVILVDDPGRENEGDLAMLAEFATPEAINFMAREGRGLVCMPMAPELCDRQAPVVVVCLDRKAARLQVQLQAQVREQHDAQRHDRGAARQAQRGQAPAMYVQRIQPQDVVRQRGGALHAKLRAHDPRHQQHTWQARIDAAPVCAARQHAQRAVLGIAEEGAQLLAVLAAGEPALDVGVLARKAVVGSYMVHAAVRFSTQPERQARPLLRVQQPHARRCGEARSAREQQHQRHLVAGIERLPQIHQHDVQAAGAEVQRLPGSEW